MAGVAGSARGVATQENLGDGGKRLGLRPQRFSTREHKKPDRYKPASGHTTRGEFLLYRMRAYPRASLLRVPLLSLRREMLGSTHGCRAGELCFATASSVRIVALASGVGVAGRRDASQRHLARTSCVAEG